MAEAKAIYEYKAYKAFLVDRVGARRERKGQRGALAKALGCQPTFVSQVLNGPTDFNLEQGYKVCIFLGLTAEERRYFLLLLQKERAGTAELKNYFEEQMVEIQTKRMVLTERLEKRASLSKEHQGIYYSSWIYSAVHIALTIPELQTRETLALYLGVPSQRVAQALEFLIECGLIELNDGRYKASQKEIRLGRDSHNLLKHHANWRTQALESLDREELLDLHYSSVFSASHEDIAKIKDLLVETIKKNADTIKNSPEKELHAICVDLFSLHRK